MNLRPNDVIEKFKSHPLGCQENLGDDAEVIVKYFNPYGAGTWLITEAEQQPDGEWLLFGLCHISEWEWGYVMLDDLERLRFRLAEGVYGYIEIDKYCIHQTIKEARR